MNQIRKDYAIKALKRLKELEDRTKSVEHVIDLFDYNDQFFNIIEESIVAAICDNEEHYDKMMEDVQSWLYDEGDKMIIYSDPHKTVNVETAEAFVDWIIEHYGN